MISLSSLTLDCINPFDVLGNLMISTCCSDQIYEISTSFSFFFSGNSPEPGFGVERWFRVLNEKIYKSAVGLRVKYMKGEKAYNSWSVFRTHFWRKAIPAHRETSEFQNSGKY